MGRGGRAKYRNQKHSKHKSYRGESHSKHRSYEDETRSNESHSRYKNYKGESRSKHKAYSSHKTSHNQSYSNNKPHYREKSRHHPNEPVNLKQIAKRAMQKYGFVSEFSRDVMKRVERIDGSIVQKAKVRDLRHLLWSSIDNIDTEDLDQIEYCERAKGGNIHIKVAIADVDAYVKKDSILDKHAQRNTTSVYTGVQIYPMFPDKLSKDITSLPVNNDRLAMVTEFEVSPKGVVFPGKVYRAVVRNKAKLVYEQVGAWLENKAPAPKLIEESIELTNQILLQHEASIRLGKFRSGQGALELQTMQTKAIVKNDKVLGLYIVEDDSAKRIIENFMIGANGVISKMLEDSGRPTLQRVVKKPKYWSEIVELAHKHNFKLPEKPDAMALSKFLDIEREKRPDLFSDLSLTVVKLLGPGEYVLYDKKHPIGHFCMAVTSYTHSTAPNRRYPDLIIQRLVKAFLEGHASPYKKEELKQLALICTEFEHAAKRVERFVTKAEGAQLLSSHLGETFDAIVTGASEKGIYARLKEPPVEGKIVSITRGIKIGQQIKVKLVNLDPYKGYIDFVMQE